MQLDFFFLDFEYSTQLGLLFFCFLLFCPWSWSLDVEKKKRKKKITYTVIMRLKRNILFCSWFSPFLWKLSKQLFKNILIMSQLIGHCRFFLGRAHPGKQNVFQQMDINFRTHSCKFWELISQSDWSFLFGDCFCYFLCAKCIRLSINDTKGMLSEDKTTENIVEAFSSVLKALFSFHLTISSVQGDPTFIGFFCSNFIGRILTYTKKLAS